MLSSINFHVEPKSSISISYSRFTNCVALNGGAIFSNYSAQHSVHYCEFIKCNASGSPESRGGAFHIKQGNCDFCDCCTLNCYGVHCSDMLFWLPTTAKCSRMQSNRAEGDYHSFFILTSNKAEVKEVNVTNSILNADSPYSFGVNYCTPHLDTKFIYISNCQGKSSTFCFYYSTLQCSCNFFNVINNSNTKELVKIHICSNTNVDVNNSSFIGNKCNTLYASMQSTKSYVSFYSCAFDTEQVSHTLVSCKFSAKSVLFDFAFQACNHNRLIAHLCESQTSFKQVFFMAASIAEI